MTYDVEMFIDSYVETALWSSNDESTPDGGEPMDKNYSVEDISKETQTKMREDCIDFINANLADLEAADEAGQGANSAGHDFWLTRNGHGAGFWDGDYPKEIGNRLTQASKVYGGVDLYVGDDGQIHS